jgi:hypothetical protein
VENKKGSGTFFVCASLLGLNLGLNHCWSIRHLHGNVVDIFDEICKGLHTHGLDIVLMKPQDEHVHHPDASSEYATNDT